MKKTISLVILGLALLIHPLAIKAQDTAWPPAVVYYNEACGMCADYVDNTLPRLLSDQGISQIEKKDYVNDRSIRPEMNQRMDELAVPLPLQSHIMTFVGDKYILGGHVPEKIIQAVFNPELNQRFKRIIIFQDQMSDEPDDYSIWAIPNYADNFVGEIKAYSIDTSIKDYLDYLEQNQATLAGGDSSGQNFSSYRSILPLVLGAGFIDGINPCAFAVLLFFIAFLFSLQKTRKSIWQMGTVYIVAIFLAYLLIGFGILKAIMFSNSPHFMAKLGAWLVIILGLINLVNYFFPRFPIKLRIPHASKEALNTWMHKATLPAAFVLGFLVGLCTFPCSGGIYVAIIGLLAAQTTHWSGVVYLLLYNVMFVLPLVIILLLASNKYTVDKLTKWEQSESSRMKILAALTMLALGTIILVFFT